MKRRSTSRRKWLFAGLGVVCLGVCLIALAAAAAWWARDALATRWAKRRVVGVSARLGVPLSIEAVQLIGLDRVVVRGVRIGPQPGGSVSARFDVVDLAFDPDGWRDLRPMLVSVAIRGGEVALAAAGRVRRLPAMLRDELDQLRARIGGAPDAPGETSSAVARSWPTVAFESIRLRDPGGGMDLDVTEARAAAGSPEARIDGASFEAVVTLHAPFEGHCRTHGGVAAVDVVCETPIRRNLPGGFAVSARRMSWRREPVSRVHVAPLSIEWSPPEGGAPIGSWTRTGWAELEIEPDEMGARVVRGGLEDGTAGVEGRIADGSFSGELHAEAVELDTLTWLGQRRAGRLAGHVAFSVDRVARAVSVDAVIALTGIVVDDRRIADDVVGPFDFGFSGQIEASADDEGFGVRVWDARVASGGLSAEVELEVETRGEAPIVRGRFDTGRFDGSALPRAIPAGLLPLLVPDKSPIALRGRVCFGARGVVDVAHPDDIELEIDAKVRRLQVARMPPKVKFERLRERFNTRFELPDGETLERQVGPETERWVPLEAIPPLLPLAVITQEDGGFYNHGGVSALHLRGSLARNLREGRFARGGSTLTMQLARNLYLNGRKTIARKLEEIALAWLLEQEFDKDELMTLYLNVVEFGPDVFGIGEAARHYFDKSPIELTPVEIVFITRLLPGPRTHHEEQFERRRLSRGYQRSMERLLALLIERGHLAPGEYDASTLPSSWVDRVETRR